MLKHTLALAALSVAALSFGAPEAVAQGCTIKLGAVLPVSGPMGQVGKRIADTGQFAVDVFNEAGGVKGCKVEYVLRDTQGQPTVGVDAAKSLVDVEGVQALIGAISSGVSLPILTAVAVPSKITQVSCCSSSPSFTKLAKEGKSEGFWFRTYATSRSQAAMGAMLTVKGGFKKTAVIYVNTDWGVAVAKQFKADLEKLGGTVTAMIAYNESQASYRAEVTKGMEGDPDSAYLAAFPVDGATLTREWISLGGTTNFIVNNSLRSADYVKAVGPKYMKNLIGYDSAQPRNPSVDTFNKLFEAKFAGPPNGPGLHSMFDAVTVVLLAMEASGDITGVNIRDNIRKVTSSEGTPVRPGKAGIEAAKKLIKEGKAIRYVGATGPLQFDKWGNVQSPKLSWRFEGTDNVEVDYYSQEAVEELIRKLDGN